MKLIIIHKQKSITANGEEGLLRSAISTEPIAGVIFGGLTSTALPHPFNSKIICAIPQEWGVVPRKIYDQTATFRQSFSSSRVKMISYSENMPICWDPPRRTRHKRWVALSNGRFATQINNELLGKVLAKTQADVLAANAKPDLLAYREKVRLTAKGKVAGFRRFYADSVEPAPVPMDWPHYIFVKTGVVDQVLADGALPGSFSAFLERCRSATLTICAVNVAGVVFDLETEDGLLNFCRTRLAKIRNSKLEIRNLDTISQDSRLVGKVLLGKNVHIGPNAIVVGPTIIGNDAKIEQGAVINSSIICQSALVPEDQFIQNRVVRESESNRKRPGRTTRNNSKQVFYQNVNSSGQLAGQTAFRTWSRFSYVRGLKRIADILAAIMVLIFFAPVTLFIALAIKLTSPGTIFFKDKRQGLHGKAFNCVKFRTMAIGADRIQETLRIVSQVDGPQFKMTDDPRLSAVGRFLRETYIDEIPQFLSVLLGQMSVVGPRPSPEAENTLCPSWRDARLSVRPGITGLWQVCRTRQPMKDFQEWIHYDIEYIRNLSPKMDLWICWQTAKKIVRNFVSQF